MDNHTFLYEYLGANIKKIRKARKVSQKELSESVALSRSSIANMESGLHQPSIYTIYEIAVTLDCELDDLLPTIDSYGKSLVKLDEKYSTVLNSLPNKISKKNLTFLKGVISDDDE